jgi:hypothetical protein
VFGKTLAKWAPNLDIADSTGENKRIYSEIWIEKSLPCIVFVTDLVGGNTARATWPHWIASAKPRKSGTESDIFALGGGAEEICDRDLFSAPGSQLSR